MARLVFHKPTEEQQVHISKAQEELGQAGVTFDSSSALDTDGNLLCRDWELDFSLRGAEIKD